MTTSNFFEAGHRIRIEVRSSNFPRFDRNLNTGGKNWDETKGIVARNAVHHSRVSIRGEDHGGGNNSFCVFAPLRPARKAFHCAGSTLPQRSQDAKAITIAALVRLLTISFKSF